MRALRWLLFGFAVVMAYGFAIRVTEPDIGKLVTSLPQAGDIVAKLLSPDLFFTNVTTETFSLAFPIPCASAALDSQSSPPTSPQVHLTAVPNCANIGEPLVFSGVGLSPNSSVVVRWGLPGGNRLPLDVITSDPTGSFRFETTARPITAVRNGTPATLEAVVSTPSGGFTISPTVHEVVNQLFVTIFIALLATVLASLVAAPLSFLAARNLMTGRAGNVLYGVTRGGFNIARSLEPLVLATVFALIVGFGKPFGGVLGLIIGTIASLGKMFSETVEDIDMGTVEAVTATGANRVQTIAQAVVPQITPNWLAFLLYHWDINVRISTIIGFVGAGGIGEYLQKQIETLSYRQAGTALLGIVLVVWSLDILSTQVRKKLI